MLGVKEMAMIKSQRLETEAAFEMMIGTEIGIVTVIEVVETETEKVIISVHVEIMAILIGIVIVGKTDPVRRQRVGLFIYIIIHIL